MAESRTFYCVMEGKPSSQVVSFGGNTYRDPVTGQDKYLNPKFIRFHDGRFVTNDPDFIEWLEKAEHTPGTGVTSDYEHYLQQILKPEDFAKRLSQQNAGLREETNRLKALLEKADKKSK